MNKFSYTAAIAALLLLVGACFGQAISGDVTGTVADASGAGIPNATVEAVNGATGVKKSTVTTRDGQYRITNLPPGSYTLTATANGFASASLKNLEITLTRTVTANLTMQVGQVASAVEVSEAPTAIDTTTATVGNTYDSRQTRDLPVSSIGLGVLNLSLLSSASRAMAESGSAAAHRLAARGRTTTTSPSKGSTTITSRSRGRLRSFPTTPSPSSPYSRISSARSSDIRPAANLTP